jgi:putative redox protein
MTTNARVAWIGPGLRLVGETANGSAVVIDHVLDDEDRPETGPQPMELLLLGLGGCTSMDVVSILKKKRQVITGYRVEVSAERADDHPHVYTDIHLTYVVEGRDVDPAAVERSIELSQEKYCSASAMLSEAANLTWSYRIIEVGQSAEKRVAELEKQIADLQERFPAHSVPPAMMIELEELEEELERARREADQAT